MIKIKEEILKEEVKEFKVQEKEKVREEKKNFKTFLFDAEGTKYFFVILYGDK